MAKVSDDEIVIGAPRPTPVASEDPRSLGLPAVIVERTIPRGTAARRPDRLGGRP